MKAACACGKVTFEARGAPIAAVVCYCDDCQEAARQIATLPGAQPICGPDGGTNFVAYLKDRVNCTGGAELIEKLKVKESSVTNRLIATCCNSAMLLNFDDSKHWVDIYGVRIQGDAPLPQMRICTRFAPALDKMPDDIPSYPGYPFRFIAKLVVAKVFGLPR